MHIVFAIASEYANVLREWTGRITGHALASGKQVRLYKGPGLVLGEIEEGGQNELQLAEEEALTGKKVIVSGQPYGTGPAPSLDGMLHRATGFYAAVAGNPESREVNLVTDYLASIPLFYMLIDGAFIACNYYRILADFCGDEVHEEWFADMLLKQFSNFGHTFLKGIRRVPPGTVLTCHHDQTLKMHQYKTIAHEKCPDYSMEESVELLRDKLVNSVVRAVSGYHRVGVELSAGIDSSTVLAYAADEVDRKNLHAFSHVNSPDSPVQIDERNDINELVAFYPSLKHHWMDARAPDLLRTISQTIDRLGFVPNQFFEVFSQHLYHAAREQKVEVLLSGFGGDQGISYRSKMFYHQLFREREWRRLMQELHANPSYPAFFSMLFLLNIMVEWFMPDFYVSHKQQQYGREFKTHSVHQFIQPQWINKYRLRERSVQISLGQNLYKKVYEAQLGKIVHPFVTQRMELGYLISGTMGFDYRYPLLDEELIRLFLAIPYQHKMQNGVNRYLVRELIKDKVPALIYRKTNKYGAAVPTVFERMYYEADRLLAFVKYCERQGIGNEYFRFQAFRDGLHEIKSAGGRRTTHYPRMVNYLAWMVFMAKKAGKDAFFE